MEIQVSPADYPAANVTCLRRVGEAELKGPKSGKKVATAKKKGLQEVKGKKRGHKEVSTEAFIAPGNVHRC